MSTRSLSFPARATRALLLLVATLGAPVAAWAEGATKPPDTYEFGDFALYVPAEVSTLRGILLTLGGPDTRAFVSDGAFGAPDPGLEGSLHALGGDLRKLAADQRLAILGSARHAQNAMPNLPDSDVLIFEAVADAAKLSGRPELASAPIFVFGISGGASQSAGFAARNPARVGALLLKVPELPELLNSAAALAVPTYLILAEKDGLTDRQAVIGAFESNRRAGGLWALALEPGVPHHSLTPGQRTLIVNWLRAVLQRRLGDSAQDPLRFVPESSGWLGQTEFGVSDWSGYVGDRRAANWFPTRATAEEWLAFTFGDHAR